MDFEEFIIKVQAMILDYMPKKFLDARVEIVEVEKPGDVILQGLTIHTKDSNLAPTFYLNPYYAEYKNGKSLETILCDIAETNAWDNNIIANALPDLTDFNAIKDKIIGQLICRETNGRYLESRVSVPMEKTKIDTMYVIELANGDAGAATTAITYNMLQIWGVTVADIVRAANENTPRLRPAIYSDMSNVLYALQNGADLTTCDVNKDSFTVVCSNSNKMQGAIAILYPGVAEEIRNKIGDFYVLPSSIHETILVPKHKVPDINELYNMVLDVNKTQVKPDEILATDVYVVRDGVFVSAMHHGINYNDDIFYTRNEV